ncbi:MAG: hypothetical protein QOH31_3629, partial [Verrucomicrobiota bacterium]
GKYRAQATAGPTPKGVIYTVAPSPLDVKRIWAGTDDGLIHLTIDGGQHWSDVTPPAISAWQKISLMDAGHFDAATAYAAVNTLRLDELHPHIFRTHDNGKTWQEIVRGIPDGETVNVVREDPQRKGMLFAGTERAVYLSDDDGENWRPLRLNMPATSVRDLIVKGDDVAVATHGRGFWILDNITCLRQHNSGNHEDILFKPQAAMRVRFSMNTDTPLPPDEPAGENPPDGAMIDYYLAANATGEVTLEIKDAKGELVRHYSSTDAAPPPDPRLNIPTYWVRPFQALSSQAGLHRFLWDLHYTPVAGIDAEYPMTAVYAQTAPAATSPWAMPGEYSVTLTANGQSRIQPLTLAMDPRVHATAADLEEQFQALRKLSGLRPDLEKLNRHLDPLMAEIRQAQERAGEKAVAKSLQALVKKLQDFAGTNPQRPGTPLELDVLQKAKDLFSRVEKADAAPTANALSAINEVAEKAKSIGQEWKTIESQDLPALNRELEAAGLGQIEIQK